MLCALSRTSSYLDRSHSQAMWLMSIGRNSGRICAAKLTGLSLLLIDGHLCQPRLLKIPAAKLDVLACEADRAFQRLLKTVTRISQCVCDMVHICRLSCTRVQRHKHRERTVGDYFILVLNV